MHNHNLFHHQLLQGINNCNHQFIYIYIPYLLFQQNNFEAIVTVNLTSLLVLATMFIGIVNSLPRTAYIKLVDVWLLFNLFMPFIEVMLHTIISMLAEELEQPKPFPKHELIKMAKKVILSFARFGMPAMYLLFCLVFFIYAKAA